MEIEMGLIEFAAEFIITARRDVRESPGLKKETFSSRQSQAISSLGISRIIRKGMSLGLYDLVSLSVITSPPEAQKYAEMIALRILIGDERDLFNNQGIRVRKEDEDDDSEIIANQLTASQLILSEVLDFLELNSSVDTNKDKKELEFAEIAEDFLFNLDENSDENTLSSKKKRMTRKEQYMQIGGRDGILSNKITSWKKLENSANKSLMRSIPNMSMEEIIRSKLMGMGNQVRELTREKKVKELSELLDDADHQLDNGFSERGKELISSMNLNERLDALKSMYRYSNSLQQNNLDPREVSPSLDSLIKQIEKSIQSEAKHMDDILEFPHLFSDEFELSRMKEFVDESRKSNSPMDLLKKAQDVDDLIGSNFSDIVSDVLEEEFANIEMSEWLDSPIASAGWIEQFNQKLNEFNGKTTREERKDLLTKMQEVKDSNLHPYLDEVLGNGIKAQLPKYQK